MSKVVIFPAANQAEAQAYADGCNAHYAANSVEDPGGTFTYPPRPDINGDWVTAYYGDEVNGEPFTEPAECTALRPNGVIHDSAVWPEEEF